MASELTATKVLVELEEGRVKVIRTLSGRDARVWYEWIKRVCKTLEALSESPEWREWLKKNYNHLEVFDENPRWEDLEWKEMRKLK